MAEEVKTTAEVKPVEVEQKVGEVIKQADKPKEVESVPLSTFLDEKNGRKQAEKNAEQAAAKIAELEASIKNGATKSEVTDDIAAIAKEFDVDVNFLSKLASAMTVKTKKEVNDETEAQLKPLKEKERQEKIDAAFKKGFNAAMEKMPEFEKIVNPEVIKTLSLDPRNADKTFTEIIEETYGNALTGRRTTERTTPGGGKEPAPLDYNRARKDTAYFKEVMANPKLKTEYNAKMIERGI